MDKENSSTAELNCLISDLTTKLYSCLGLTKDELYDQSTATGLYQREVYKRLYGCYPK